LLNIKRKKEWGIKEKNKNDSPPQGETDRGGQKGGKKEKAKKYVTKT